MTELPFQLVITNIFPKDRNQSLTCSALLRDVPGKRKVYDATWNSRPVIAKLFFDKISASRHVKREWKGLTQLQKRALSSPKPFFYGKTKDGGRAIVMEKIPNSKPAIELFLEKTDLSQKLDLLILICTELARQHAKGVIQKDLHLGNFLLAGNNSFAIDPAQMKFYSRKLKRKKCISQLASLAVCLPPHNTEALKQLCDQYAAARHWDFDKSDEKLFASQLIIQKKKNLERALKKTFRTSKRQLEIKMPAHRAVVARSFCQNAQPAEFIEQIDDLMDTGQILKAGNTCYLSRLTWNQKDIVIKRYNHKNLVHSLRHTLKKSRARRSWLNANRLNILNIDTPLPLAYVEKYKAPLLWKSYIVTEFTQGQNLHDFLQTPHLTAKHRSDVIERIETVLEKLHKQKITHGDLKKSNILITDKGPVLTDLDAMKVHKLNCTFNYEQRKDLKMFSKLSPQL